MTKIAAITAAYQFNRAKTLELLTKVEQLPDPQGMLIWRPGPGRAHLAWQLLHVAITEEIFATERLAPQKKPPFAQLWPNYRGGSTPVDSAPPVSEIRDLLNKTRQNLQDTLSQLPDDQLGVVPTTMAARGLTLEQVLHLLSWHEAHHQGQAHLTLNLYKAAYGLV
ncbi:MAG: DinB family protein [Pirellulales bacterium]|nr:DinB family protein [Pirellulales bacterium]